MAYGQQFLFEHRWLVDFQKEMNIVWLMVNKSYLKLDQWLIFKKEMSAMVVRSGTSAAGRFSLDKLLGAIFMKMATLKKCHVRPGISTKFMGDDLDEKIDFWNKNHVRSDISNEIDGGRS